MIRAALRIAVVGACALALSGCISLLPKTKPAQLYRFGQPVAEALPVAADSVAVLLANGLFPTEAAGDRILTITDGKAAYLAQSRWVAPAALLFRQAVLAAFDSDPGVRLVSRGQQAKSDYVMRLDVRNFEARYENGPKVAPTVVVRVRAVLTRNDLSKTAEQIFETRVRASDDRVGAIVAAYEKATAEALGKVMAWTKASAA